MDNSLLVIAIIGILIIVFGLYGLYVNVVKAKNAVYEALSSIDVQLKKRYDLIPNILTIAKSLWNMKEAYLKKLPN